MDPTPLVSPTPVPVSFQIPHTVWYGWLLTTSAIVIAVGVILGAIRIMGKFIGKASLLIYDFGKYHSVMVEIAKEFKANTGTTLKDAITRIENTSDKALAIAQHLEKLEKERQ